MRVRETWHPTTTYLMQTPRKECCTLRVLVADSYEDSASSLALLLGQWGHKPETAFDSRNALALTTRWWPDVAIIDTGMLAFS